MKRIMWTTCTLLWMFGLVLSQPSYAAEESPIELLKSTQQKLESMFSKKLAKTDTQAREKREQDVRKLLEPYFYFTLLAQRTLGSHWKQRSEAEQKEFTFWLRGLLEQAYLQGMRNENVKTENKPEIVYKKQKVTSNDAVVFTQVRYLNISKRTKRKRWKKVRVNWLFQRHDGKWKVVDIVTNDNSLVETYKEQFDKIISKKNYAELVSRIQKKVNQFRKDQGLSPLKWEGK